MTHLLVAIGTPHGPASVGTSGTHWFAIGLLVGMLAIRLAPGWLVWVIITSDIVALGWSFHILRYTDTGNGRWVLVAIAFLLLGLYLGATRGLKMLGEHEFLGRRAGMKARGWWLK